MRLVLLRPPNMAEGLYINPFRLQDLFHFLVDRYSRKGINVELVDCQAGESLPVIDEHTMLLVDTPDGTQVFFSSQSFREYLLSCSFCYLVGEIVTDGDALGFLNAIGINNCSYIGTWNFEHISSIIDKHVPESTQTTFGVSCEPHSCFGFSTAILDAVKKHGDRVHLPGITAGCEFRCTFCRLNFHSEASGTVRDVVFDLDSALTELAGIDDECVWDIQFTDENFFGGTTQQEAMERLRRIESLCAILNRHKNVNRIGIDTRCDTVINAREMTSVAIYRDRTWREFVRTGLDYVYLGVESVAPTQVQRFGKRHTTVDVSEAINYLRRLNWFLIEIRSFDLN